MNISANEWQLQEAKNKLSQLVKNAGKGIPQYITVHGRSTAVVLSTEEYEKLKHPESTLSSILVMPIIENDEGLFDRNDDTGRTIDL